MDVKRRLKFTKEELDNIYSGEVLIFYTDEEIAGFKEKYLRPQSVRLDTKRNHFLLYMWRCLV